MSLCHLAVGDLDLYRARGVVGISGLAARALEPLRALGEGVATASLEDAAVDVRCQDNFLDPVAFHEFQRAFEERQHGRGAAGAGLRAVQLVTAEIRVSREKRQSRPVGLSDQMGDQLRILHEVMPTSSRDLDSFVALKESRCPTIRNIVRVDQREITWMSILTLVDY